MTTLAQVAHITIHGNTLPNNNELPDRVKSSIIKAALHSTKPRVHCKNASKRRKVSSLNPLL